MRGPWRRIGIMRGRSPWNHGSTPGKEWKDKWMGNPSLSVRESEVERGMFDVIIISSVVKSL
jgi:hypothetical protein